MRDGAGQPWATPDESTRVPTPNTAPTGPIVTPSATNDAAVAGPPSTVPPPITSGPTPTEAVTEPRKSRSPMLLIVALVAVVAGGAFAATQLLGDDGDEDSDGTATALVDEVVPTTADSADAPSGQATAQLAEDLVVETVAEAPQTVPRAVNESFEPVDYAALTEEEIFTACYSRLSSLGLATCLRDGIAAGRLDEGVLLAEYEFLECRAADLRSGFDFELDGRITNSYELTNAEYTRLASEAAVCFQDKVDRGLIEEYEVPADYLRLDCAGGLNPYPQGNDFFEAWLDCIYELN